MDAPSNPLMGNNPPMDDQQSASATQTFSSLPRPNVVQNANIPNSPANGIMPQTESPSAGIPQIPEQNPQLQIPGHAAAAQGWRKLMGVDASETPGHLFRSILAGALMGMGSAGGGEGGFAGGMSRGIAGVSAQQERQAAVQRQQAQQKIENDRQADESQRAQDADTRAKTMMDFTMAQGRAEMAARQHQSDLQDKTFHEEHNARAQAIQDNLEKAGGTAPVDGSLPASIPAYDLATKYTQNPGVAKAPNGYVRHFIDKTDASEVTWDGQKWTHPDGTSADMTSKATIQVLDVPEDAMTKKRMVSGKDLNAISGKKAWDPDGMFPVAPLDMVKLGNDKDKSDREKLQIKIEQNRQAQQDRELKQNEYRAAHDQTALENTGLQKTVDDPMGDPKAKADAQSRIDANNAGLKAIYEKIYPDLKLGKNEAPPPPPADPLKAGLSPIASQAFDAFSKSPSLEEARIALAKVPAGQLSDTDRAAVLASIEKKFKGESAQTQSEAAAAQKREYEARTKNASENPPTPIFQSTTPPVL